MSQTKTWLGIALAWWMVWGVQAQSRFPDRPVSMLVPFGPGGTTDIMARILADEFTSDAAFVTADFILRRNK